jgi:hypothetical protein
MKPNIVFIVLLGLALGGMARHPGSLSEQALVNYAKPFHGSHSWSLYPKNGFVIGTHLDTKVVAEVRCSDVCPDYTRMVIHYDVAPGPNCRAIGGREVDVLMPFSIAVRNEKFCVPVALVPGSLYSAP